ncbi:MAG: hypothetical protein HWD58_00515 [Bacteroidota bacterium]|nr:MAG: hypothetical protein HWD58_00515 [Bacteroidota bacterium]
MKSTFQRGDSTSRGMNMIAVALGLLVGYLLSRYFMIKGPFAIFGSILFFLGMANILSSTILKSNFSDAKNNIMNNPKLIVGLGLVLLAGVIFFIGWDIQKRRADRHNNRNGATSSKTERISRRNSSTSQ